MIEQLFWLIITNAVSIFLAYLITNGYSNRKLKDFILKIENTMNERIVKLESYKDAHEKEVQEKEKKVYEILNIKMDSIKIAYEHLTKKVDRITEKIDLIEKEAKEDRHAFRNEMNESFALFRKEIKEDIKTWK